MSSSHAFASTDSNWLRFANQAETLRTRGQMEASRNCWIEALKRVDTKPESDPWTPLALRNIVTASLWIKDIDTAEKYSIKHVAELEKLGDRYPDLAQAYVMRGRIFISRGDFKNSQQCMLKAYQLAHTSAVDLADLTDALLFLSANHEVLNERKKSKICEQELIATYRNRRGTTAFTPISIGASILLEYAENMPDKPKKAYMRVARDYYEQLMNNPQTLGTNGISIPRRLLQMAIISDTIGEQSRAFDELMQSKNSAHILPLADKAQLYLDIAHRLSLLKKIKEAIECTELGWSLFKQTDRKSTYEWILTNRLGELYAEENDFENARKNFLEALGYGTTEGRHCRVSIRLAECAVYLNNTQDYERYRAAAIKDVYSLKKKNPTGKTSEDWQAITSGFWKIYNANLNKHDAKATAQSHYDLLAVMNVPGADARSLAPQYVYQAILSIEARQIDDAEKAVNEALALAKYSVNEPQKNEFRSKTNFNPPDDIRWKYIETFRARGLCALYRQDSKTAIKFFQEYYALATKRYSWTLGTYYAKFSCAMVYLQVGMLKDAEKFFQEVCDFAEPQKPQEEFYLTTCFWYAVTLCEDGEYAKSEQYRQRVLKLSPDSPSHIQWNALAKALEGRIASRKGNHAKAQALFVEAISTLERASTRQSSQDIANIIYWQIQDCLASDQKEKVPQLAQKALQFYSLKNSYAFTYEFECRKLLNTK